MSWSDRRSFLLLLAPLALAACGFTPALAPDGASGGAVASIRGSVRADDPKDRNAFDFVARIEERLGRPSDARYALSYTIRTDTTGVAVTADNRTTRYDLRGALEYRLTEPATGAEIASGRVHGFTGYAATGSTVALLAAEEDAARRLMVILADQVVTRLVAAMAARG